MAKAMKQVLNGVLASALEANSPEAKRKKKREKALLNVVTTTTLKGASDERTNEDTRWTKQMVAFQEASITPADEEWKNARKSHEEASSIWLEHMRNIITDEE